jgi:hypothetical protein
VPDAADLEPLLRFWRAQDKCYDRVDHTWWGAVISDPRYPAIQEPNYARVETTQPVDLDEVRPSSSRGSPGVGPAASTSSSSSADQTDLLVGRARAATA